jgi:hypothetical protein
MFGCPFKMPKIETKDFGSSKICGQGPYPKTFLVRGQAAKGSAI